MVNDQSTPSSQELPPLFGEPNAGPVTDVSHVPPPVTRSASGDRPWLNLIWDAVLFLLAGAGVLAVFLLGVDIGAPDVLGVSMLSMLPILLLAMAIGITLRAGVVNFAVGHLAGLTVVLYVVLLPMGELSALLGALGGGILGSLIIALAVTLLRTPAWAASLLVIVATLASTELMRVYAASPEEPPPFELAPMLAWIVVAGVIVASIAGGAIAMLPPVRRLLHRTSYSVESTGSQTAGTVLTVFATQLIAGVLATAAGLLTLVPGGISMSPAVMHSEGLVIVLTALGIVLLGGTSLRGGRGGVAGTVLAAIIVYVAAQLLHQHGDLVLTVWVLPIATVLVGLIVSRVLGGGRRTPPTEVPVGPAPMAPMAAPIYEPPQPDGDMSAPITGTGFTQQLPVDLTLSHSNAPADTTPTHALPGTPGDAAEQQYWPPADPAPASDTPTIEVPAATPPDVTSADARETSSEPPTLPQQSHDPYQYRPPAQ